MSFSKPEGFRQFWQFWQPMNKPHQTRCLRVRWASSSTAPLMVLCGGLGNPHAGGRLSNEGPHRRPCYLTALDYPGAGGVDRGDHSESQKPYSHTHLPCQNRQNLPQHHSRRSFGISHTVPKLPELPELPEPPPARPPVFRYFIHRAETAKTARTFHSVVSGI